MTTRAPSFRAFSPRLLLCILTAMALFTARPVFAQDSEAVPKVSVAAAYTEDIQREISFIGRGEAIDTVDIIARVSGFVENIAVGDGAVVESGDLLFEIEPDTYEATLESRRADLARAEANLNLRQVELARKEELFRRGSVPASERDVARANELAAEADVRSAKAAIRQAELDLSYTKVQAPFTGRIGRLNASVGDLVGPSAAPLVTLVREAPIFVTFSLSEKQLVDILERLDTSAAEIGGKVDAPDVYVELPNGSRLDETGKIVFGDNRVDPTTGTIAIRAEFENKKGLIVDGAFLNVHIQETEPVSEVLIPQAAVQRDQRGDFVLVVNESQMVEQRYIQSGDQIGTAVVVQDGLREGEAVIVEGLQRVRPGVAVEAIVAGQPGE